MKRRLFLIATLPLMLLSLNGCKKKADFQVGIIQWVAHPALDRATKGFKAGLKAALGSKTVDFEVKNAADDPSAASSIVNTFVSKNKHLIMANATPAVQTAASATATIPVVGTSVTSYEVAFGGTIPPHVTGTSDLAPLDQQAQELLTWFPDASKVGIFYCASEPNSVFQSQGIRAALSTLKPGITCTEVTFTETNEIQAILSANINSFDVLYIPTDNKCADNAVLIHTICSQAHKPVFAGEENICERCGVATLSIDYLKLGKITGQMAAEILLGANPKDLEIRYDADVRKLYNATIAAELGIINIPEGYTAI